VHTTNLRYFSFIHNARIIMYEIFDAGVDDIYLGVSTIRPGFFNYSFFGLSDAVNVICTLQEQKFLIGLILMVPVYAVQSVSRFSRVCFLSCIFVQ
jgi:hypothetical protein